MMRRLAAIAAILRAAAGLDAQQPAQLHLVGIEVAAMDGVRGKQQIVERRSVERLRLRPRPVVTRDRASHDLELVDGQLHSIGTPPARSDVRFNCTTPGAQVGNGRISARQGGNDRNARLRPQARPK